MNFNAEKSFLKTMTMSMNRREFLILTAAFAAGCSSMENVGLPAAGKQRVVNAGPVGNYAADGVCSAFRNQGFFIVRRDEKLFALSAICTHRKCKLDAEPDRSFHCPCHGSTFDPNGHVTGGPARRDLPVLATSVDENGQILVTVTAL
ncbi:MAG: Rieske (2Fe-2S) protein [Verrucomicrobiia bacterium]